MVEKSLLLQILDTAWKEHLLQLDHLRQGIGLRAYAQRDPLNEYKREAFNLFEVMLHDLRERVTSVLSHVEINVGEPPGQEQAAPAAARPESRPEWSDTPRNSACPCGSGRKFKHCHGQAL
jgi:preprotein translocase subunit SecA